MKTKRKIKIMAPIDKLEEFNLLTQAGADEFFCGILIDNENISCRRDGETKRDNFTTLNDLEILIKAAKENKVNVFVAFNRPSINSKRKKIIKDNIKIIKNMGVSGVIISDLDLLNYFKNKNIKLVASSLIEAKNYETVKFLKDEFGIKRVILDRQVTLKDIKGIVERFPNLEIETFIMNSACRSLASACHHQDVTKKKNHLCCSPFSLKNSARSKLNINELKIVASRLNLPIGACGICALYSFKKAGVNSVKVVGRGKPTEAKIKSVRIVKEALELLDKYPKPNYFYRESENLFKKIFNKECQRQYCYYPHFFNNHEKSNNN